LVAVEVRKEYPTAEIHIQPDMNSEGDPMLLSLMMNNLFDNACKYAREGVSPEVSFGSKVIDGETVYSVQDNGIGIDMKYAHKLFRPFERLHGPERYPGTGIGLANVARTIERHGGRIWLESEEGKGTNFMFTLGTPR
jgi:signal transduction histidine kinase